MSGNESDPADSDEERRAADGGLADADSNQMESAMSADEVVRYQQRYRERWRRWLADLSWSKGPMRTWKPVMTEQQQRENQQYVAKHNLPF